MLHEYVCWIHQGIRGFHCQVSLSKGDYNFLLDLDSVFCNPLSMLLNRLVELSILGSQHLLDFVVHLLREHKNTMLGVLRLCTATSLAGGRVLFHHAKPVILSGLDL